MWMAPTGIGAIPAKMAGGTGGGGECAIRPDNCARSVRATKSVIDLKVDAELSDFRSGETLKGIPGAVTIPQCEGTSWIVLTRPACSASK